jgi:hypothetical protein
MKRGVLQNEFSSFELQPELDLTWDTTEIAPWRKGVDQLHPDCIDGNPAWEQHQTSENLPGSGDR